MSAKTYKIYSLDDRKISGRDGMKVLNGLMNGSYYYAGSVEVDSLEEAWMASQNDTHPNPVTGYESGNPIYGPAIWNGEFAQPSTKVGDVFLVDGEIHRVAPAGFKRVAWGNAAETIFIILDRDAKRNPWAHEINEDFDSLITD